MVSVQTLINELPPFRDEWITINPNQAVKDIIIEVCEAHEEFAPYYENIALYFDGYTNEEIANNLYAFIKNNIKYQEESDKSQTTALPTGILMKLHGDCKHYSGFAAGVLDALKRQGKKINWCYRFASYRMMDKTPHHVFVVINPGSEKEIWIDPTPNADRMKPSWYVDKKVNTMLQRNIGNIDYIDYEDTIGKRPYWQLMPAEGVRGADGNRGTNPYFTGPFLGLQHYLEDPYSIEGTDWNQTAAAINQAVANGPSPGHTIDAAFAKWIYDSSAKGWNFYYPMGVQDGFTATGLANAGWPTLYITDDGRLTLTSDVQLDDYMNNEIHALTAWAQSLINQYDPTPYPVKPRHIKEFSQMKQGNNDTRNLFTEARGASFIKEIGKGLENVLNIVKEATFKIIGSIPRNAFLVLVGLNIFNIAKKMQSQIDAGHWAKMADRWKDLGGNPDKLANTIADGAKKPDPGITQESTQTIGEPATAATMIAAAAPVIAAMLAFIKDDDGKLKGVLQATKAAAQKLFPDLDLDAYGFLDAKTGKQFNYVVDDADNENYGGGDDRLPGGGGSFDPLSFLKENPMLAAAAVGGALYLIPKKKNIMLAAAAAAATYFLLNQNQPQLPITDSQKLLTNG